jgi:MFS family permease
VAAATEHSIPSAAQAISETGFSKANEAGATANDSLLAPRYRALTLGMVALVALCAFESLAVATAMPNVAAALDGLSLYALSFAVTLAASVIGLVLAGHWSDGRSAEGPLWTGAAAFVVGLLVAGLAANMLWLLGGRIVQGLGAGLIGVALHVLVARAFPEALRPRVFAAFSAAWVVPSLVGPLLAGLIVEHLGWRWVFLSVAPLTVPAVLLLRSGLRTVPGTRDAAQGLSNSTHQIGWASIAALGAGLLHLASQLHGSSAVLLCAAALLALAGAVPRLLPSGSLLARQGLPAVIAMRGIASGAFFGTEIFIPLLLSREYELSLVWAGGVLMIGSLGWSGASWYQGHTRRHWSRAQVLQIGMLLLALGVLLLTLLTALLLWYSPGWARTAMILAALVSWSITGFGMGLVSPSLSVLTLALSPAGEQGRNSSALQLADALGTASMLAAAGGLFTLLWQRAPSAAYPSIFATTCALALLGWLLAGRARAA